MTMNTSTAKGFESRLPSKSEIKATSDRFRSIIRGWRTQKLKVVFAYLNALTYRACRRMGILQRVRRAEGDKKGFHRFVGDIKAIALKGVAQFNITIEGVVDQLANFWGVKISEASLRKYRYELRDVFGLFQFQSQPVACGDKGNANARRPPALKGFNLPLACILLEVLEDVLVKERDAVIDEFPGNAGMCRFIYNALFKGLVSYRRKRLVVSAAVIYQGGKEVYVDEMDWYYTELNEQGLATWYGAIQPIPDEDGVVPMIYA